MGKNKLIFKQKRVDLKKEINRKEEEIVLKKKIDKKEVKSIAAQDIHEHRAEPAIAIEVSVIKSVYFNF